MRDRFDAFRAAVARSFAFLEEAGFTRSEKVSWLDIDIRYSRQSTEIGVGYEIDSVPWAYFSVDLGNVREPIPLAYLIEDADGSADDLAGISPDQPLEAQVALLAQHTRRYGHALLAGDNSRLAQLRALRVKHRREQNRELYGTATGESPRFDHRPSLREIFADARNREFEAWRCYEAVWDHGYSREDIAAFRGTSVEQVQALLAFWEQTS